MQPAVGDPASAGALDWVSHRGPFQLRPFCDSVLYFCKFCKSRYLNFMPSNSQKAAWAVCKHIFFFLPSTYSSCITAAADLKMPAEVFKTTLLYGHGQQIFFYFCLTPTQRNTCTLLFQLTKTLYL